MIVILSELSVDVISVDVLLVVSFDSKTECVIELEELDNDLSDCEFDLDEELLFYDSSLE